MCLCVYVYACMYVIQISTLSPSLTNAHIQRCDHGLHWRRHVQKRLEWFPPSLSLSLLPPSVPPLFPPANPAIPDARTKDLVLAHFLARARARVHSLSLTLSLFLSLFLSLYLSFSLSLSLSRARSLYACTGDLDGQASRARFLEPRGLDMDAAGTYFAIAGVYISMYHYLFLYQYIYNLYLHLYS